MGKVIDITDKLKFEESPKLRIKGIEINVKDDASTMLKVMGKLGDNITPKDIGEVYELLIPEKERIRIDKLKLNFSDFEILVRAAISLVTGNDIDEEYPEE